MSVHPAPALRWPRAWFFGGGVIAAIVTFYSLIPAQQLPNLGISDKVEHASAYALLAFWFASVLARRDWIFLLLALVAFGGGIEIAQGLMKMGRQADLLDLAANTAGAIGGLAVAATPLGRWSAWFERRVARR